MIKQEERLLAAAIYVLSLFTTIIGPLIIWLIKKDESDFIDYHGKAYFNFLISYFIYGIISAILILVLIGIVLAWIVGVMAFIFTIVAAYKAYKGEAYKIPLTIEIIK